MEIVQERLEREFDLNLITTAPSVVYQVPRTDGEVVTVDNPAKMPAAGRIERDRGALRARRPSSRRASISGRSWSLPGAAGQFGKI